MRSGPLISLAFLLLLGSLFAPETGRAQVPTGKEFVVVLPALFTTAQRNDTTIKFSVEVLCARRTKVSIQWANGGFIVRDAIVQAGARQFLVNPWNFAMLNFVQAWERINADSVNNRAFVVTADQPVTVHATFSWPNQSETYTAVPTTAYDTDYTVITYNGTSGYAERSGFVITARENNTVVTITPSEQTTADHLARVPYTITLGKHQAYQALSTFRAEGKIADLTLTRITSTKPIGLVTVARTNVYSTGFREFEPPADRLATAKTIMEEQLPPDPRGTTFYAVPFAPQRISTIRIAATQDNTTFDTNGVRLGVLARKGDVGEFNFQGPVKLETSKPVAAMQYGNSDNGGGQPMMVSLPPVSIYKPTLQMITPSLISAAHYVMITAPTSAINSVRLDGAPVTFTQSYPDGKYMTAVISVLPRAHFIEADAPVSAFAYGSGRDSYGATAGEGSRSIVRMSTDTIRILTCSDRADTNLLISNSGNISFPVDSVRIAGIDATNIQPADAPLTEVLPGVDGRVSFRLLLPQPGVYNGTLRVYVDAQNKQLIEIPIIATRDSAQLGIPGTTIDFGVLTSAQTSRDTALVIRNNGTRPLVISGATLDRVGFTIVRPTPQMLPRTIQPGATDTIVVRFAPVGDGLREATLRLTGAPCMAPQVMTVRGFKGAGSSLLVQRIIDYSVYLCGAPAVVDSTVTFRNGGEEAATITTATITGPAKDEFTLLDALAGQTVPAGGTLAIRVRYTPGSYGARIASLDLTTTAANAPTLSIDLRARRDTASITASVESVSFGRLLSCDSTREEIIVLTNDGTVADTVKLTSASGAYVIAPSEEVIIYPGRTQEVRVRFAPATSGVHNGELEISGRPCGLSRRIGLSGERSEPSLSVASSVEFGRVWTCDGAVSRMVELHNDGSVADTVIAVFLSGSGVFTTDAGSGGIVLEAGERKSVEVRFTPTGAGSYSGTLTMDWGPCGGRAEIALSGEALAPSDSVSRDTVDFGVIQVNGSGRQTVELVNGSGGSRQLDRIEIDGASGVRVIRPTLPATVGSGEKVEIELEYAPQEKGTLSTSMRLVVAGPCGEEHEVVVVGRAEGDEIIVAEIGLGLPVMTGAVDEVVQIPVRITRSTNLALLEATELRVTVGYRYTMLEPVRALTGIQGMTATIEKDEIVGGERRVTLLLSGGRLPASGEVARLEGRVLLGDADRTALRVVSVGATYAPVSAKSLVVLEGESGELVTTGICETGGERLVRIGGGALLKATRPNPFRSELEVEFDLLEGGWTRLVIYDGQGTEVGRLVDEELVVGRYVSRFNGGHLSTGVYYCELRVGSTIERRPILLIE